ncbi:ankyrin repeat domain-containing protein [Bartonella apis]|uniref:hypothetical protein n=1 Tax=Bartonella apis TaxID=1686310 RepID=UPI001177F3C8|nr:hypothetical protein [Bartonella apis]
MISPVKEADKYFKKEGPQLYSLAQRIEAQQPITIDDIKALPEGSLNKRYSAEITLLFFALEVFNAQAIDVLLEAGADPYMVDSPSSGSTRDFAYYFSMYNPEDKTGFTPVFVNTILASYLKHGGDPNHHTNFYVLSNIAISENYTGVKMVAKAGGDVFEPHDEIGYSAAVVLAADPYPEGQRCLSDLIDEGYLDQRPVAYINRMLGSLEPHGSGDLLSVRRNRYAKLNAEKLLVRYPEITDNDSTKRIFGGSIPWKDLQAGHFTDPVTGERI